MFGNIANGVPTPQIMVDLQLSQLEVDQARQFVAKKITQYLVQRRQPTIACNDMGAIRANRGRLLAVLQRMGNIDLSTDLILDIKIQDIDAHAGTIADINHSMQKAYK